MTFREENQKPKLHIRFLIDSQVNVYLQNRVFLKDIIVFLEDTISFLFWVYLIFF